MGVIFRQTLKSTIYSYIGVIFGFVTAGWLMPKFLTPDEIGVFRLVQYYAMFVSSILGLGVPQSLIKMFPHFKNEETKHHGLVALISLITFGGILGFYFLFQKFALGLLSKDFENSALFFEYYHLIFPFTVATLIFTLFDSYSTANKESTIGVFLKDFVLRVLMLGIIGAFIFIPSFDYNDFINSVTYSQFLPTILLLIFLFHKKLLPLTYKISYPSNTVRNEFFSVAGFNWVNGLSSVAVVTIDSIMLAKLTNAGDVGIYSTVTYYAGIMLIPNKSLGKIATAVISQHFKDGDSKAIESIYIKSALTPFILGLILFGNLIFGLPFIFDLILKPEFATGKWVLIFLALSNLFKMSTGVKFSIIFTSKYYKWSTLMFVGYLILIVITNLLFIPMYGITGAAIASLIATTLFHVAGLIFVKVKFNYWPFESTFLKVLGLFIVVFIPLFLLPDFNLPIIASIVKGAIFTSIFFTLIFWFRVSDEINNPINNLLHKYGFKKHSK